MAQDVKIEVALDLIDNLSKDVSKIRNNLDGLNKVSFGSITKTFSNLGNIVTGVNQAIDLVSRSFNALASSIKPVINAAAEQEKAETLLVFAMQERGIATDELVQSTLAYANTLQLQTGVEDEAILNAQRYLIQMGVQKDSLNDLTKAAIDYSAATGTDLQSAISNIGRVIEGGATSLGRFKLGLSESATEGERTAKVLEFLSRFTGTAQAQMNTFSGSLSFAKIGFNELQESLGRYITNNTFVVEGLKLLGTAFLNISKYIDDNRKSISDLVKNGIIFLVDSLSTAITILRYAGTVILGLGSINDWLTEKIFKLAKGYVWLADTLNAVLSSFTNIQRKDFTGQYEDLDNAISATNSALMKNAENFETVDGVLVSAQKNIQKLSSDLEKIPSEKTVKIRTKTDSGKSFDDSIGDTIKKLEGFFKGFTLGSGGAKKLVDSALTSAGTAIGAAFGSPAVGEAVAEVVKFFAVPAEEFKKQADEFFAALPQIIEGISENIPYFVDALISHLPRVVEALNNILPIFITKMSELMSRPEFWNRVINAMIATYMKPAVQTQIATGITIAFVQAVPAMAQALVNAIVDKMKGVGNIFGGGGGGGGGIGGFIGGIGKKLGFANGADIPNVSKYRNDGFFPAALDAGESVIPRSTTERLNQFLNGGGSEQNLTINLQIGESQLAQVITRLNQRGFRLA